MKTGPKTNRPDPTEIILEGKRCLLVPLTKSKFAIIDKEDGPLVVQHAWVAKSYGSIQKTWYAERRLRNYEGGNGRCIKLHRFLTGEKFIDHINCNGLDNRRSNLRKATPSQNAGNSRLSAISSTGFKGVSYRGPKGNRRGRWVARINDNGRRVSLGSFQNVRLAALAYNVAAFEKWGSFARLNTFETT